MAIFKLVEGLTYAAEAAEDLTGSLNRLMKIDSSGNIARASTNEKCIGSLFEVPLASSAPFGPASVQIGGIAKVVAGAAVAAGARVSSDSQGRAVTGSTNPAGVALAAASAAGEVIPVALIG